MATITKSLTPAEIEKLVDERAKALLDARMAELKRTVPREAFNGDDALFLAWMAGFTAGVHVTNPNDKHAMEIFNRCRGVYEKISPIAPPPVGGS